MPVDKATAYPGTMEAMEQEFLRWRRRRTRGEQQPEVEPPNPPKLSDLVGVALSGGGIRTATFSLGFLQAMARARRLDRIDYLSTVSGGSYLGAFLGGLYLPRDREHKLEFAKPESVREQLEDSASGPVRWLRDNGRYLAPAADADALVGGSSYLRNLISIHVVMAVPIVAIFLAAFALRAAWPWQAELEKCLRDWAIHGVWPSPYLALPLVPLLLGCLPLGAAYWLMPAQSSNPFRAVAPWLTTAGVAVAPFVRWLDIPFCYGACVAALVGVTVGWAMFARRPKLFLLEPAAQRLARSRLSQYFGFALALTAFLLVFALADTLGQTIYAFLRRAKGDWSLWTLVPAPIMAVFAGLMRALFSRFAANEAARPGLPLTVVAGAVAVVVVTVYAVGLATVGHAVAWRLGTPNGNPGLVIEQGVTPAERDVALDPKGFIQVAPPPAAKPSDAVEMSPAKFGSAAIAFSCALLLAVALGRGWAVLNLSTLQTLYAGRVTRAYLGASNAARHERGAAPLSDPIPGDDIPFHKYEPWKSGGPLHLIGIAINETVSGETQTEYRDRRGLGFTVGPAGLSAAVHHHALWGRQAGKELSPSQRLRERLTHRLSRGEP